MSSIRFMRIFVFFDLPTETNEERRAYRHFREALIKNGFLMLQESVYCKLITSPSVEASVRSMLYKSKPASGLVQMLSVTEKQFSRMEYIVGESHSEVIDNSERLIIL